MASPADDADGEILVRNIHLGSSDVHQLPADPVYVVYKRRWYILAVVSVLNVSNAMVRTHVKKCSLKRSHDIGFNFSFDLYKGGY